MDTLSSFATPAQAQWTNGEPDLDTSFRTPLAKSLQQMAQRLLSGAPTAYVRAWDARFAPVFSIFFLASSVDVPQWS